MSVYFWPKGEAITLISIEHNKLKNAREGTKMRKYWAEALGKLKMLIEQ